MTSLIGRNRLTALGNLFSRLATKVRRTMIIGISFVLVAFVLQRSRLPTNQHKQKSVQGKDTIYTFHGNVLPLLQSNCKPCHFPGGKVFKKLPFDDYKTVASLGKKLNTRLKKQEQQAILNGWIASGAKE